MKAMLATLCIAFLSGSSLFADVEHFDGPSEKIGEYRVTLNSLRIKSFAAGFLGDPNPDIIIKTFTQAETHDAAIAIFGIYEDWQVPDSIGR